MKGLVIECGIQPSRKKTWDQAALHMLLEVQTMPTNNSVPIKGMNFGSSRGNTVQRNPNPTGATIAFHPMARFKSPQKKVATVSDLQSSATCPISAPLDFDLPITFRAGPSCKVPVQEQLIVRHPRQLLELVLWSQSRPSRQHTKHYKTPMIAQIILRSI